MPTVEEEHPLWKHLLAKAIVLCGKKLWVAGTVAVDGQPIWHKMKGRNHTKCGFRVTAQDTARTYKMELDPPEEHQCIVCQFGLSHLVLMPCDGPRPKQKPPKHPKPPPPSGPESPYTPNPPTAALIVPKAIAA